jgi:hypothetical protein
MRSNKIRLRNSKLGMLAAASFLALLMAGTGAVAQSAPDAQGDGSLVTATPAALIISSAATKNVRCKAGVCRATAAQAVLSVKMLRNLLAKSPVSVVSGHAAKDIQIAAPLTWVSSNTLTLDAFRSIIVVKPVSDAGAAGLTLITNDGGTGGTLYFGTKANVSFLGTSNILSINGSFYTLVNHVAELATQIAANAAGHFALSGKVNALADGTYHSAPIPTTFTGAFEGLGNTISSLKVVDSTFNASIGLFAHIGAGGVVENVGLLKANMTGTDATGGYDDIGALAGENDGTIGNCYATGAVKRLNDPSFDGGLVGSNLGAIMNSHASVAVSGVGEYFGGLVGLNSSTGTISKSYATGTASNASYDAGLVGINVGKIDSSYATGAASNGFYVGGLVAINYGGQISNSYATGSATGGTTYTGGFVGANTGTVSDSYSTGVVTGAPSTDVGGFMGFDNSSAGSVSAAYWDVTTSGIHIHSQGAGSPSNDPGIAARTTVQLQTALPKGFSKMLWGKNVSINGGLPYLLALPPQ